MREHIELLSGSYQNLDVEKSIRTDLQSALRIRICNSKHCIY